LFKKLSRHNKYPILIFFILSPTFLCSAQILLWTQITQNLIRTGANIFVYVISNTSKICITFWMEWKKYFKWIIWIWQCSVLLNRNWFRYRVVELPVELGKLAFKA
jgi:hypothetical protein